MPVRSVLHKEQIAKLYLVLEGALIEIMQEKPADKPKQEIPTEVRLCAGGG
jgi:hypothetical protein